jgi:hypothetical protein
MKVLYRGLGRPAMVLRLPLVKQRQEPRRFGHGQPAKASWAGTSFALLGQPRTQGSGAQNVPRQTSGCKHAYIRPVVARACCRRYPAFIGCCGVLLAV